MNENRWAIEHATEATIVNGVPRWNSNGKVPPNEVLDAWLSVGIEFDYEKAIKAREKDNLKFFNEYREVRKNYTVSDEELYEMRAAFGSGTQVVDVITGNVTNL